MMNEELELIVNGKRFRVTAAPGDRLLDVLREQCLLTGTKEGCGVGECGACSVLVDGRVICSCIMPVHAAAGHEITTIEGLENAAAGAPHPVQQAFMDADACQCGFCIPGMVVAAKALLDENPSPTDEEIARGLSGNLCRCTGYARIFEAVRLAAERIQRARMVGADAGGEASEEAGAEARGNAEARQ